MSDEISDTTYSASKKKVNSILSLSVDHHRLAVVRL